MRIILGDHHPEALWALKTTLQEKSEFEVIGVVDNAQDLLTQIAETPADLVLVDWELPGKKRLTIWSLNYMHALPNPSWW
jgi:DNA-binding NarL/FixJ family response regulator